MVELTKRERSALEVALQAARSRRHWVRLRRVLPAAAPRLGQPPVLKEAQRQRLAQRLGEAPERHRDEMVGWTMPLLAVHFAEDEHVPVSETTRRRVLRALGYRWKRPRNILVRRDPAPAGNQLALTAEAARVRADAPGTVVLKTIMREFPALPACWG